MRRMHSTCFGDGSIRLIGYKLHRAFDIWTVGSASVVVEIGHGIGFEIGIGHACVHSAGALGMSTPHEEGYRRALETRVPFSDLLKAYRCMDSYLGPISLTTHALDSRAHRRLISCTGAPHTPRRKSPLKTKRQDCPPPLAP